MRSWGNLKIMDLRVAILHGVLYMSKGWENAHGNLKFGKSRFLTHPTMHAHNHDMMDSKLSNGSNKVYSESLVKIN